MLHHPAAKWQHQLFTLQDMTHALIVTDSIDFASMVSSLFFLLLVTGVIEKEQSLKVFFRSELKCPLRVL
jgi:hypothetical protein